MVASVTLSRIAASEEESPCDCVSMPCSKMTPSEQQVTAYMHRTDYTAIRIHSIPIVKTSHVKGSMAVVVFLISKKALRAAYQQG